MPTSPKMCTGTLIATIAIAGSGLLAGCGSAESDASTSSSAAQAASAPLHSALPKDLQDKGSITIASNVEYPPFEFFDKDNKTVLGIDREIADGLEKQLGIKIKFENISFDAIIPGLASGRYKMAMSAMTDNKTRQKQVNFVDYFSAGAGLMVKDADKGKIKTLDDLCGKTVGIVKGTTEIPQVSAASKKCTDAGKPAIDSVIFPGQNQTILALQNNRVEVVAMDSAPGGYAAKQASGIYMNQPYEAQPFGIVVAKDDMALATVIQQAMQNLKKSGDYDKALNKWGLSSGSVSEFTINGGKNE